MSADVIPFPEREPEPEFVVGRCTRWEEYTERGRIWTAQGSVNPLAGGVVHADMSECSPLPPQRHALGS